MRDPLNRNFGELKRSLQTIQEDAANAIACNIRPIRGHYSSYFQFDPLPRAGWSCSVFPISEGKSSSARVPCNSEEIERDSVHGLGLETKSVKCKNDQYSNTPIPIFHLRRNWSNPEARTSSIERSNNIFFFLKKSARNVSHHALAEKASNKQQISRALLFPMHITNPIGDFYRRKLIRLISVPSFETKLQFW